MNDDLAFLHSVAENPDELGPRLRYADFLDDKRDAPSTTRAEFIRVQCALDSLPPNHPSFESLQERERELLEANWHLWLRPVCQALGEPLPVPPLKRTWGEWMRRKFRQPNFSELGYSLHWNLGPRPAHAIVQGGTRGQPPYLSSIYFIGGLVAHVSLLHRSSRGPIHLDRLFERAPISQIKLSHFPPTAIEHLIRGGFVSRLRKLQMYMTSLESLAPLMRTTETDRLREFHIHCWHDRPINPLGLLQHAVGLRPETLGLHFVEMAEADLDGFLTSHVPMRLQHLILEGVHLPAAALVRWLEVAPLRQLDLIGPVGLRIEQQVGTLLRRRFPNLKLTARGHALA